MRKLASAGLVGLVLLTGCAGASIQGASYVDDAGAQLRGNVMSTRTEAGSWWVEWGRSTRLGHSSPHGAINFNAGESQFVSYNLNNRDPETTYYWRLCADDQDPEHTEPGCSSIESFTTSPAPPGADLAVDGGWRPFHNQRDQSLNQEGAFRFEGPADLTLVDSYCASDRFRVFDGGGSLGRTGRVLDPPGCTPYVLELNEALADRDHYSRGTFSLGPGPHSIRIKLLAGDGNQLDNGGWIRVDTPPFTLP